MSYPSKFLKTCSIVHQPLPWHQLLTKLKVLEWLFDCHVLLLHIHSSCTITHLLNSTIFKWKTVLWLLLMSTLCLWWIHNTSRLESWRQVVGTVSAAALQNYSYLTTLFNYTQSSCLISHDFYRGTLTVHNMYTTLIHWELCRLGSILLYML